MLSELMNSDGKWNRPKSILYNSMTTIKASQVAKHPMFIEYSIHSVFAYIYVVFHIYSAIVDLCNFIGLNLHKNHVTWL